MTPPEREAFTHCDVCCGVVKVFGEHYGPIPRAHEEQIRALHLLKRRHLRALGNK